MITQLVWGEVWGFGYSIEKGWVVWKVLVLAIWMMLAVE